MTTREAQRTMVPLGHALAGRRVFLRPLTPTDIPRIYDIAVCTVHQVLLSELCPGCGLPARYGPPKRGLPAYPSLVPEPGACTNPGPDAARGSREPCGYPLAHAPSGPSTDTHFLLGVAQATLDSVADGTEPAYLAGQPVPAADYFAAVHDVFGILAALATAGDLVDVPDVCVDAFAAHVAARDRAKAKGDWAPCYKTPPRSVRHAAALLPHALPPHRAGPAGHRHRSPGQGERKA